VKDEILEAIKEWLNEKESPWIKWDGDSVVLDGMFDMEELASHIASKLTHVPEVGPNTLAEKWKSVNPWREEPGKLGTVNANRINPAKWGDDLRTVVADLFDKVTELEERCELFNQASGAYISSSHRLENRVAEIEQILPAANETIRALIRKLEARESYEREQLERNS